MVGGPHLEGAKVCVSQKRKLDTPMKPDDKNHCPNTVDFTCPRVAQRTTRSHATPLLTIVEEFS